MSAPFQDTDATTPIMTSTSSTIDLSDDPPARQAELIKQALGSVGFFSVQGSSLTAEDIGAMFTSLCLTPSHRSPLKSHDGRCRGSSNY